MKNPRHAFPFVLVALLCPTIGFAASPRDAGATSTLSRAAAVPSFSDEMERATTTTLANDVAPTSTSLAAALTTSTLSAGTTTATLRAPDYPFLKLNDVADWTPLRDGIWYRDTHIGKGKHPSKGVAVYLNFTGHFEDGTEFINTKKKKTAAHTLWYVYTYGNGEVMKSLEDALATMREGGKRVVVIPSDQAYGKFGYKPPEGDAAEIPPDATLIFDVTLLWIREAETEKLNIFK